jgi:hypothetical protein
VEKCYLVVWQRTRVLPYFGQKRFGLLVYSRLDRVMELLRKK